MDYSEDTRRRNEDNGMGDEDITELVDFVLVSVANDASKDISPHHVSPSPVLPTNSHSRRKSKLSKAKRLFCLERKVGQDGWETVEFPKEEFERDFALADKEGKPRASLYSSAADPQDKPNLNTAELQTQAKAEWKKLVDNNRETKVSFGHLVNLYVQDIISDAVSRVSEENAIEHDVADSHHKILLRTFGTRDSEKAEDEANNLAVPTAIFKKGEGNPHANPENSEDDLVDGIVTAVLNSAVDRVQEEMRTPFNAGQDLKRSMGILQICPVDLGSETDETDRKGNIKTAKLVAVTRFLGLRSGKLHKNIVLDQPLEDKLDDVSARCKVVPEIDSELKVDLKERNTSENDSGKAPDTSKRTKAFSRKFFNRVFGGREHPAETTQNTEDENYKY